MIHRVEISKDIVFICGDKFLKEFYNCLNKEINKYKQ